MTERTRSDLAVLFADGERPDGQDFRDVFESCLNKASDGLSVDGDQTLVLARGLRLGNSAATAAGALRFNGGQVQFNNGAGWQPIAATTVGFGQVGTTAHISFGGTGFVGIGDFSQATQPTYQLEVNLTANTGTAEQVRFGNAVICNGTGVDAGFGMFAHRNHASNSAYALRQGPTGAVHINAPGTELLSIRQNNAPKIAVTTGGRVVIGSDSNASQNNGEIFQVAGSAYKNDGNGTWANNSDARVKYDVHDLEAGLEEIRRVRPVRYRYNGRAGTQAGLARVGILAQEIEQVLPETVEKVPASGANADELDDMRIFNPAALTFVLINAVKQLAEKVEALESASKSGRPR